MLIYLLEGSVDVTTVNVNTGDKPQASLATNQG
jgi:hypothetical protein